MPQKTDLNQKIRIQNEKVVWQVWIINNISYKGVTHNSVCPRENILWRNTQRKNSRQQQQQQQQQLAMRVQGKKTTTYTTNWNTQRKKSRQQQQLAMHVPKWWCKQWNIRRGCTTNWCLSKGNLHTVSATLLQNVKNHA